MLILGVTGGIGSGKSTVALLLEGHGARIADADRVVRELYEGGPLVDRLVDRFGERVRAADGSVDRDVLGEIVFESPQALRDLEAIVHPEVRRTINERLEAWRAEGFDGIAVVDAALLVEAAEAYPLDHLVVVTAPESLRVARLADRGVPPDESRRRMLAQSSDADKIAAADHEITNGGSLQDLARAVGALLRDLGRDADARSG